MSRICCGATKIGAIATVHKKNTIVNSVPIFYCPICNNFEVHSKFKEKLNFVVTIAKENEIKKLDIANHINMDNYDNLFEGSSTIDNGNLDDVVQSQIDIALDLLAFAKDIKDKKWEETLKQRLHKLSKYKDVTKNV